MTFWATSKTFFYVKTTVSTFVAAFGNFGLLFIPTSGHTGPGDFLHSRLLDAFDLPDLVWVVVLVVDVRDEGVDDVVELLPLRRDSRVLLLQLVDPEANLSS